MGSNNSGMVCDSLEFLLQLKLPKILAQDPQYRISTLLLKQPYNTTYVWKMFTNNLMHRYALFWCRCLACWIMSIIPSTVLGTPVRYDDCVSILLKLHLPLSNALNLACCHESSRNNKFRSRSKIGRKSNVCIVAICIKINKYTQRKVNEH